MMVNTLKNLISAITFFIILHEIVAYSFSKFDNTEMFNIRSFTEKTNDKRLYTLKKNFIDKCCHLSKLGSQIMADELNLIYKFSTNVPIFNLNKN